MAISTPPRPLPAGENFPELQSARFGVLARAMTTTSRLVAAHFRDFAVAVATRAPIVAAEMRSRRLDEFDDAIDRVLGTEIAALGVELSSTLAGALRPVVGLGGGDAAREPGFRGLQIAFDIERPDVTRWLDQHALELVQGLDRTTRDELAGVLRRGVQGGMSIEQIARQIVDRAKSMSQARARLIAQTEVMRSYNFGKVAAYRDSGLVSGIRFVDGQFGACDHCRSLNGAIVSLDGDGFTSTIGTTTLRAPHPPLHPGCRCTTTAQLIAELQPTGQYLPQPEIETEPAIDLTPSDEPPPGLSPIDRRFWLMTREAEAMRAELENTIGTPSAWNGTLKQGAGRNWGVKNWDCSVGLNVAMTERLAIRYPTLIHEMIHAQSTGLRPNHYPSNVGWEEGVVEKLQRLLRPRVLRAIGHDFDDATFSAHDVNHAYNKYIAALDNMRIFLGLDEQGFYLNLIRTGLWERHDYLHKLGVDLIGNDPAKLKQWDALHRQSSAVLGKRRI